MNIFKTPEGYLYSNRALLALFIPLLIEYGTYIQIGHYLLYSFHF